MTNAQEASLRDFAESTLTTLTDSIAQSMKLVTEGYPSDDASLVTVEGIRHLSRLTVSAHLIFMQGSFEYPYLVKLESVERQFGLPGVDCVYHYAQMHGDYEYVLTGNRGSARVFEIEVWDGSMSQLREWKYYSTTPRSIEPGEDLTVRFSRKKQDGDWIELPEGECCVLIRQYYYDWENEQPAYLYLERPDAIFPPPQLTQADVEKRIGEMALWLKETTGSIQQVIAQYLAGEPDKLQIVDIPFGFAKLRYLRGYYRCQPDEAIILRVKPPEAQYWNFQLGNMQWEALDYHQSNTAVNGHQCWLDDEGNLNTVVCHSDPGVANWLDTNGRTLGLITGRYFDADSVPQPTLEKVKLQDLDNHLPANTPRISPEQRQELLRARQASTVRRQCGD